MSQQAFRSLEHAFSPEHASGIRYKVPKRIFKTSSGVAIEHLHKPAQEQSNPPAVLAFHGWMVRLSVFSQQLSSLSSFDVLLMNNRGHGKSELGESKPETYIHDCARDAKELMDSLSIKNPHVIGFSMGALIASAYNSMADVRSVTFISPVVSNPRKTSNLVLLAEKFLELSQWMLPEKSMFPSMSISALEKILSSTHASYRLLTNSTMPYERFRKYLLDSSDMERRAMYTALKAMIATGDEIGEGMAEIKAPVLVIRGERDPMVDGKSISLLKERIPHAHVISFKNATHYPHEENPHEVNSALDDFFSKDRH
jgi:pimeloyl-ACP methyl ester carboxylesterase